MSQDISADFAFSSRSHSQFTKWLTTGNTSVLLFTTVIGALIFRYYYSRRDFYRLAKKIHGPKPVPFIGNALEYLSLDHIKVLDYLLNLMSKYNGLAKVWLGNLLLVHISKPEDIELLLSSNKMIEKNVMYRFFDDILGQGLLNARGDIWRKHRKIIAPTFHPTLLKHFVKIFSQQSQVLVQVLERAADGKAFNVFPYIRNCSLDLITETALESHIEAQLRSVSPATKAAERLMNITYNRMFKIWLYNDFIFYKTKQGKEYRKLRDVVRQSMEPLMDVKRKELSSTNDVVSEMENTKRKSFFRQLVTLNESGENFNEQELRDEVTTMIITGYETTAATISFVLVMLGIYQDVQDKVYEEVVAMQDMLKGRELEAEDLVRFEYMDRVIKETLRLYPVGPVIFREASSDLKLTTCTIPKGASIAVVILSTHRDPSIWNEPNKFNPDNFLPENVEKRHPYAYIPFSAGPRNCIGKKYAYLSMRVMIYHILSKYRIFCDKKIEDLRLKSEVTLKMSGGFNIRLEPR
ncbi:UNVERIFIED_CONTAM: hypothetical protein PYX00_000111 [Menopon gallinae]|uniref:Cytochrome P450 n=1 Tax=Menopon gallinae TaxID=328185 RepID=A0AAW2I7B0_9NEOP